ncbi:MAG: hypothetical protein IPG99_02745 [Ignavibacteria bacterium]|nr:hypothetical protein [Ignavibacteria bacterium]
MIQDMVKELIVEEMPDESAGYKFYIKGVRTELGRKSNATLLSYIRTFLNAIMHTGKSAVTGGRIGEKSATGLSEV